MGKQTSLFGDAGSPANAQLSGFIKSIRLRRTEDAVLWFISLWRSGVTHRERVQRRLLICAAEDNLNVEVMRRLSDWYSNSVARCDLKAAVREILRITDTPNWYATEQGRRYIREWFEAELTKNPHLGKPPDCLLRVIERAVHEKALLSAMHGFNAYYRHRESNHLKLAQLLCRLAIKTDNQPASALAELFEENVRHLWNDTNFSGQTLAVLVGGPIGASMDREVPEDEVVQLIAQALTRLVEPMTVPEWCLDGIHTGGRDPRFAGTIRQMNAMCRAYEYYGRLDPADEFLPEFYEIDGCQSPRKQP